MSPVTAILLDILKELRQQRSQDDDMWTADEIADFLKLSKGSVQNKILGAQGFPSSVVLPTGGRRWIAKEIRAWAQRRR